jgi:hypothetical protein
MKTSLAALLALGILLPACSGFGGTSIPTPNIPTDTQPPAASATLAPLDFCPPQNNLPAFLETIQPKTAALVPGARVSWYDDFHCGDLSYGWVGGGSDPNFTVVQSGGVAKLHAKGAAGILNNFGRSAGNLGDNRGMLLLFRVRKNTTANFYIFSGDWQESNFRRWGLALRTAASKTSAWEGWEGISHLDGSVLEAAIQPDTWYYLLIRLGGAGQVSMALWEKDNPANRAEFQRDMGLLWQGLAWTPWFQLRNGIVELDEYQELTFD